MRILRSLIVGAGCIAVIAASFFTTLWIMERWGTSRPTVEVLATEANIEDPGWPNHTMRVVIPSSAFSAYGRGVGIQFGAGKSKGLSIARAFIGYPSTSGGRYGFESSPRPITFGGKRSVLIPAAQAVVSDVVAGFQLRKDRDLLIAYHIDSAQNDAPVAKGPTPGWRAYYKGTDDSETVDAVDYVDRTSAFVSHGILSVRVQDVEK